MQMPEIRPPAIWPFDGVQTEPGRLIAPFPTRPVQHPLHSNLPNCRDGKIAARITRSESKPALR
jgi:hypothetical protein